ncbi:MAG: biotin carboxylase, partial [Sinobacterium sp.]|nr:biotin carboxylase [Sinobacterium sp.]
AALKEVARRLLTEKPNNRFRLKAIAGGGGKGQRILQSANSFDGASLEEKIEKAIAIVPELTTECLIELKTNGVGDNKNVLIEMNIETTRHQEIQVIGNGEWCMTMGGRDCSLQMHEQKLLEVSVTEEELTVAIAQAKSAGQDAAAKQLEADLNILTKMEAESARFGEAVKLNSLGTFECIVDGDDHYFMEMNTRIQVEHRVTELCYGLRFTNPENDNDFFETESLVEAMSLVAVHGKKLPKPTRFLRKPASVEARLNATNEALQPHAGGIVKKWSNPIDGEVRDDQGISLHNPDTGMFMQYRLAGAYDSNIALLLTVGNDRLSTYQNMAETIRRTHIQGTDLKTNLEFHYGLVNWFIGNGINARPTTRFIVPYLTAVGELKHEANQIDLDYAFNAILKKSVKASSEDAAKATQSAVERKRSLLLRPIENLFADAHTLAGWLSLHKNHFNAVDGHFEWTENPVKVLADTYHYLNMEANDRAAPARVIWSHDEAILTGAIEFYAQVEAMLDTSDFAELDKLIAGTAPKGFDETRWSEVQASHAGFQLGMSVLDVLPYVAFQSNFYALEVNDDLSITIPERLEEVELQETMAKVLVPPPVAASNEIVSVSGGMFYPRETPEHKIYVKEGDHFNEGDTLYIVEVMKMFNKVQAEFSGTIDKVLVERDGEIIKKGQPLFNITPDEIVIVESPEEIKARKAAYTDVLLKLI